MKILHVINSLEIGGAEKLIVDLVPCLRSLVNKVDVLLLNGIDTPLKQKLFSDGIHIVSLGIGINIYNPLLSLKLIKYIKNYDIVHVHLFPAQYWVALAKILSFSKVKLVTTEHSTNNRRRNIFAFIDIDRFIYKQYSKIICISDSVKNNLSTHIDEESSKIITIPNGVNTASYINAKKVSRYKILGKDINGPLLVQVASFRKAKDQDTVIRAIAILPKEYHLALVGDGIRKGVCENLAIELGVADRVHFLGIRNDVPEILHTSDLVVMSSHWEGFGLAAVEGMVSGKPTIASNVAGLSEVVEGAGVLFEPGDYKQLSHIIQQLMSETEFYKDVAYKCKERAMQYDIITMVLQYEKIYLSVNDEVSKCLHS